MKVALISRSTMYSVRGGDTIQVLKTSEGLKKLGVDADIFPANESIPYEKYDLLHFFNIIRPADHYHHIIKSRKPYVVSTIYIDYSEFDTHGRNAIVSHIFKSLGCAGSEYVKNVFRYLKNQDKLVSPEYLLGHNRIIQKILKGASLILPNSMSEYNRIAADFGHVGKYAIIPNGVDFSLFSNIPANVVREDKVICVAQIYGLKNQLSLINACNKLGVPLELVGSSPPNHHKYLSICKTCAGDNVRFIDFMPQDQLVELYASAMVHAMPSWFETTGLSSLEAGAMGCNLVVGSGGDTGDYFTHDSWFCEANDQESIENALGTALKTPNSGAMREAIIDRFTWDNAAKATLQAYHKALL